MPKKSKRILWQPADVEEQYQWEVEANGGRPVIPADDPLITLYTGAKGMGKSVSAVAHAATVYAQGIPLFHNGAAHIGTELDVATFRRNGYSDCIVLIDELEEYLNNLRTGATVQVDMIGVLIQMRHQGVEVVATTQYPHEINGRFLRRVDNHIICHSNTNGKSVHHIRVCAPWDQDNPNSLRSNKAILKNAWKFHDIYDHRRYVSVGSARLSASELRADAQLNERNSIWGYVISCALTGSETVKAGTVQHYLSTLRPPAKVTTQKIGAALREFELYGFALEKVSRHGQANSWRIPAGLAEAYAADQPDEAARIRGEA